MTTSHVEALQGLALQLDDYAERHPHLRPFAILSEESDVDTVLSEAAAKVWDEISRTHAEDPVAWHHLAIIYHGRAYQGYHDVVSTHQETLDHWRLGTDYWLRVIRHEPFWNYLRTLWSERAKNAGDMLAQHLAKLDLNEFRQQLPPHLIKIHETIIIDTWQKHPNVARDHFNVILNSSFDLELIRRTRAAIYSRVAGDVSGRLKEMEFQQTRTAVECYLKIDPGFVQALADRLQVTIKESERIESFNGQLSRFRTDEAWARQLQTLMSAGLSPADAFTALGALCDFYFYYGMVYAREADNLPKTSSEALVTNFSLAAAHFATANEYERGGQKTLSNYERCAFLAVLIGVINGCSKSAITQVRDEFGKRLPSNAVYHLICALLHHGDNNAVAARASLEKAKDANSKRDDQSTSDKISTTEQIIGQGNPQLMRRIGDAMNAMSKKDFASALLILEAVLSELPEPSETRLVVLTRSAQCNFICQKVDIARRRIQEAQRLLRSFPMPDLERDLQQLAALC